MSEPFLIAHKVRGEPAFDIAEQMPCPVCIEIKNDPRLSDVVCNECEGEGFWWIIPTSGHRARPYWSTKLEDVLVECAGDYESVIYGIEEPPPGWPDHYPVNTSTRSPPPAQSGADLLEELGL